MTSLVGFLEEIEKLAYKLLLWVILIPKTVARVIVHPRWAAKYVRQELQKDAESPFDEYISPIVLLLVTALLPAMFVSFLPKFGATILSPADGFVESRVVQVEADVFFRSYSADAFNEFKWVISTVQETEFGATALIVQQENRIDKDGTVASFVYTDQNRITDTFAYEFAVPGKYVIQLIASKVDSRKPDAVIETLYAGVSVLVPENPDEQIHVSKSDRTTVSNGDVFAQLASEQSDDRPVAEFVADELTNEATILLALALMLPPLLFALATKLFTEHTISERGLKESFYAQCYYFSPLAIAIWATFYANYFMTPDIFLYGGQLVNQAVLFVPLGLAFLWFFFVEISAVIDERQTSWMVALSIVAVCTFIILGVANFFFAFTGQREVFRVGAIWAYPLLTVLALVGFILARIGRRFRRR